MTTLDEFATIPFHLVLFLSANSSVVPRQPLKVMGLNKVE